MNKGLFGPHEGLLELKKVSLNKGLFEQRFFWQYEGLFGRTKVYLARTKVCVG